MMTKALPILSDPVTVVFFLCCMLSQASNLEGGQPIGEGIDWKVNNSPESGSHQIDDKYTNVRPLPFPELSPSGAGIVSSMKAEGTAGFSFTSAQVFSDSIDQWPFRAIGKLYITSTSGSHACSASLIAPRVLLTAGHCVHTGNGLTEGWYDDFVFAPAYSDESLPYGIWQWSAVGTTNEWFNGGGQVPNSSDFAMIVIQDQSNQRVGDVVGWLGWDSTDTLEGNHVTMFGYPGNLDNGAGLHEVNSGKVIPFTEGAFLYGSDMGEGSNGGPWVRDWGFRSSGQDIQQSDMNRVVGVTSGVAPGAGLIFSSSMGSSFVALWSEICALAVGNCS